MNRTLLSLVLALIFSCTNEEKNPSGLNPETMTEEELYSVYGLEAPPDLYRFIFDQCTDHKDFASICEESTASKLISIEVAIIDDVITDIVVRFSDSSANADSLIIDALLHKKIDLDSLSWESGNYSFRLDIDKLCDGPYFTTTPMKDSTLKTMPISNRILEENKGIMKDPD